MAVLVAFDPCRGSGQRGSVMHVNDSGQRVNTTSKARPVWHLSMVRVTHMCGPSRSWNPVRTAFQHHVRIGPTSHAALRHPPPSSFVLLFPSSFSSSSHSSGSRMQHQHQHQHQPLVLGMGSSQLVDCTLSCLHHVVGGITSSHACNAMAGAYAAIRSCRHVRHVL